MLDSFPKFVFLASIHRERQNSLDSERFSWNCDYDKRKSGDFKSFPPHILRSCQNRGMSLCELQRLWSMEPKEGNTVWK